MSNTLVSSFGPHLSTNHHPTVAHRISTSHKTNQWTPYVSTCLAKYSDYVTAGHPDEIDKPGEQEFCKASQEQAKVSPDMISAVQNAAVRSKAVTPLESFALSHPFASRLASTGGLNWRHCPRGPDVLQDSVAVHSLREILLQAAAGVSMQPNLLARDRFVTRRVVCRSTLPVLRTPPSNTGRHDP